jgi:hypothetical protein
VRVRLIGYWCYAPDRLPDLDDPWPDPRDLIDESWDSRERERVASYFEQGFEVRQYMGSSECRLCGACNGSTESMDGAYLWPEGLAHYVREHSVKPPDEVLVHIRRRYEAADRGWAAEYADRVFLPEGVAFDHERGDEVETLVVDRVWWQKVTSA